MSDITISLPKEVNGHVICSTRIRHILAIRKSILMQIYMLFRQQAGISALRQELEVKTPYRAMNHPVTGVVTKADLASMEHISLVKCWLREAGAHNVLVTSAVNNNGVTELLPCSIQKKAVANFDRFSDENDDGDTQIRINEQ